MRSLWHVAAHDLRQHLSERSNIFFLFLMPLGFVFFFSLINSGGSGSDVAVSLPVIDRDGDFLSEGFIAQLTAERFQSPVYTAAAAETTVFNARHVEIPADFTARVLGAERTDITLRATAGSNTDYDLAAGVRLHLAQVRFLGNLWRWSSERGDPPLGPSLTPADVDADARQRFLDLVAEPSRVTVTAENAGTGRPVPRGARQSIPGVLVMFVVMTVLIGGSESLTREKLQGTLRRLATTPLSARQVLLGKTLGLTLLGLVQSAVLVVATEVLGRLGVAGLDFLWAPFLLGVAPVLLAYCFCVAALGLLISGLLRTPQQAPGALGGGRLLVAAGDHARRHAGGGPDAAHRLGHDRPAQRDHLRPGPGRGRGANGHAVADRRDVLAGGVAGHAGDVIGVSDPRRSGGRARQAAAPPPGTPPRTPRCRCCAAPCRRQPRRSARPGPGRR